MTKRLLTILVPAVLAASCAKSREVNAVSSAQVACSSCHGDPARDGDALAKAAPPASVNGAGGGGAHLVHLENGVACGDCHVVPTSSSHANGTIDVTFAGTAIANGASPAYGGAQGGSCSGVYCHGATLGGGNVPAPVWSGGPLGCGACHGAPPASHAPTSTACSGCHPETVAADGSLVPGGKHLNGAIDVVGGHASGWSSPAVHGPAALAGLGSCRSCHGQNLDGAGGNGPSCQTCHYQSWQSNCTFCHGTLLTTYTATPANLLQAAPPRGTKGEASPSDRAVGAHQRHLAGGALGPAVSCETCHTVPTDLSHVSGGAATVIFGTDASRGGPSPTWNGATCASTYCHGASLQGGSNTAPTWTAGSTQTTCGSCHGVPPPSHDAASTACGTCHGAGYSQTTVSASLHMNGTLDAVQQHPANWALPAQHGYAANRQGVSSCTGCHTGFEAGSTGKSCNGCHTTAGWASWQTNCTFCHGTRVTTYTSADLASAAPPAGTEGETSSTARAVGAHQRHLAGGTLGPPVTCDTCHLVPADLSHVNGSAVVTFGPSASRGGPTPTWNGSSCSSTYCHGGTGKLLGGLDPTPVWTAGSSQVACGSCHGLPPPAPHPQNASCGNCHTGYGAATVNLATHMNGAVDENATCTSCHGKAGQTATAASPLNAAPPADTTGASTGLRVGAHQAHLVPGPYTNGFPCQTCHANVASYTTSHANGTADVGFTGAANANLRNGTYVARSGTTAASCSATWCHGAVISRTGGTSGGTVPTPSWTSSITACTPCHPVTLSALPNRHAEPKHSALTCDRCHGAGYSGTTVNLATHVDGVKTIVIVPTGIGIRSWNSQTGSCTPSCHGQETW